MIPDMYCLESVTDRLLQLVERLPAATHKSKSKRLRFKRCEKLPLSSELRSKGSTLHELRCTLLLRSKRAGEVKTFRVKDHPAFVGGDHTSYVSQRFINVFVVKDCSLYCKDLRKTACVVVGYLRT